MMSEWPSELVGKVAKTLDSKRIPLSRQEREKRRGPYPYYGATGIMDYVDDYLFEGLHVLIAEDGSVKRQDGTPFVQLVSGRFWVNNHAHVLKAETDTDTRYLYYALSNVDIYSYLTGSVQPKLTQENLKRIPIPWPGVLERGAIAHILGTLEDEIQAKGCECKGMRRILSHLISKLVGGSWTVEEGKVWLDEARHLIEPLDDKIELNRRMSETLEAMARAIFKAWFVDFEPVRAKMEGRWRRGESLPGLPAHLYDLFPDRLVDSELGKIPEGWEIRSLDEIARFLNGLALQKYPPEQGRDLPVIKIAQLRAGHTVGADLCRADIDSEYIVEDGDVLFSWSGSLECVLWAGGRGALNQHLFKVTSDTYPKWFFYYWIHEHLPDFRYIAADKATTMGHIQRHHLTQAKVVVAFPDVINAANALIAPLLDRVLRSRIQSRTLAALRDALLPKLISGELRIKDAERFLKERGL